MNTPLVDAVCDSEAARLLPWYVTGRLGAEDSERVARHASQCALCRTDLEEQRALRARLKVEGSLEYAPQAGLAATLARIDELGRSEAPAPGAGRARVVPPWRRPAPARWLAAAVIVQAIGLLALGGAYLGRGGANRAAPAYHTLSNPVAAGSAARIRAVFVRTVTLSELRLLLRSRHLVIVDGPSEAGVFTLGFEATGGDRSSVESAIQGLRTDPNVQFAEPLAAAAMP